MTSKVFDKNQTKNFYNFYMSPIIYQSWIISSDKIYTFSNNQNSKEGDEVNSETKQEYAYESSCENNSEK